MCGTIVEMSMEDGLKLVEQRLGEYRRLGTPMDALYWVKGKDVTIQAYPSYDEWLYITKTDGTPAHNKIDSLNPCNPFTGEDIK